MSAVELNFSNLLWGGIGLAELALVTARFFLHPGPMRLSLALCMPLLLIVGAVANAIYNRVTTGHALDDPFSHAKRR
jgi:hypothetical protein